MWPLDVIKDMNSPEKSDHLLSKEDILRIGPERAKEMLNATKDLKYKVLRRREDGALISACEDLPTKKDSPCMGVQYRVNEWTTPLYPECWLLCFDTIKGAVLFAESQLRQHECVVWRCEAPEAKTVRIGIARLPIDRTRAFWKSVLQGVLVGDLDGYPYWEFPKGTMAAPTIRLIPGGEVTQEEMKEVIGGD